jgi:hypothetical protein
MTKALKTVEVTQPGRVIVDVPGIPVSVVTLYIESLTGMIQNSDHGLADKLLADQGKKTKSKRPPRNQEKETHNTLHFFADGVTVGFPAGGIKKCIKRGAKAVPNLAMTDIDAGLFVMRDEPRKNLVRVEGDWESRRDIVHLQGGTPDVRYRAFFPEWRMTLNVQYNEALLSLEQVITAVNNGGFSCGLGDWRPQRSGDYGRFRVVGYSLPPA